jgi:hypothetical protein
MGALVTVINQGTVDHIFLKKREIEEEAARVLILKDDTLRLSGEVA